MAGYPQEAAERAAVLRHPQWIALGGDLLVCLTIL